MPNITEYTDTLLRVLSRSKGRRNSGLFIDNNNGDFSFDIDEIVTDLPIVDNDDDLGYAKATLQSNRYIFETWRKISRGGPIEPREMTNGEMSPTAYDVGFSDAAIPRELEAFYYDSTEDRIGNTIDSFSLVGLVSNDSYMDFDFDVIIKSISDWQNDPVGLIVAYVQDPDGTAHTLEVKRSLSRPAGSTTPMFAIIMDGYTVGATPLAGTDQGLDFATGEPATGQITTPEGKHHWGANPWINAPEGVRIRVERRGDIYTAYGSKFNSNELVEESKLVLDLNERPYLARFKQPVQYGFFSTSQDNVNWEAIQRPTEAHSVYDVRDQTTHKYVNSEWVISSPEDSITLCPGKFYFSPVTRKVFHCDHSGVVRQIKNAT